MSSRPRRPLRSHPAFAPFCGAWLAALCGLSVGIVPAALLPAPLLELGQTGAAIGAALLGGIAGIVLARALAPKAPEHHSEAPLEPAEDAEDEVGAQILSLERLGESEESDIRQDAIEVAGSEQIPRHEEMSADPLAGLPAHLRSPLDRRTLAELGTTELLERFAAAVHRRMMLG